MTWWLSDGRERCEEITSSSQLTEKLGFHNFGSLANTIIGLDNSRGHSVLIGLGGDVAYLNYRPNGNDPPYFSSVNPAAGDGDDRVVAFEFGGSESEIPLKYCIPFSAALQAMREYFETQQMPQNIRWEQD